MPLAFRAKGASLATATNWSFNWLVGELTPILMEKIGWRLYFILAFFALVAFITVYFCYPETSGVPLEEIGALFGDEINVPQDEDDEDDDEDEDEAEGRASEDSRHRRRRSGEGSEDGTFTPRPIRRSISSHPRLMSEEERAARQAAARVAAEERRAAQSFFGFGNSGPIGWIRGMFGGGKKEAPPDRRLYEEVRSDEH